MNNELVPQKSKLSPTEGYSRYERIAKYGRSPEVMQVFNSILRGGGMAYIESAILAVKMSPPLQECTPQSIFSSALRAATLKLSCDPSLGHAWLVPYKNSRKSKAAGYDVFEANFQAGWRGIQHMAIRTGKYWYINVSKIYEGEEVIEDRITGKMKIVGSSGGKTPIGLIASFKLISGLEKTIYMSNDEMEAHGRKYSKAYNRSDSVWQTNKEAAYHKTILLKLLRTYGYLDPIDADLLDESQAEAEGEQIEVVGELEMPEPDDVTIIDRKPLTMKEANRVLGMDDDDDDITVIEAELIEPEYPPEGENPTRNQDLGAIANNSSNYPMTLEDACKITTSEGLQYGKLAKAVLEKMLGAMNKQVEANGLSPLDKAEIMRKIAAAKLIIEAKKDGSIY